MLAGCMSGCRPNIKGFLQDLDLGMLADCMPGCLKRFIGRPSCSKMSFPWNSLCVFGRGCTILFLKRTVRDSEGTGMLLHLVLLLMPFDVLWHLRFCPGGCPQTWSRPI